MPSTLRELLTLERLDRDLFRGGNIGRIGGSSRIFGGQVVAQSLMAAYGAVEDERVCHSLHGYFMRPGDVERPIIFQVDRAFDGGSFATRRVVAMQEGRQIFNMAASFQRPETGFEHQTPMPQSPPPEGLKTLAEAQAVLRGEADRPYSTETAFPADFRVVDEIPFTRAGHALSPPQKAWFRVREPLEGLAMHQAALAYCSDMVLLSSAIRPHGVSLRSRALQHASLDHTLYFLHPVDLGRWHLHAMDSPAAAGARGLATGSIYREDGLMVGASMQEGLMRYRPPTENAAKP